MISDYAETIILEACHVFVLNSLRLVILQISVSPLKWTLFLSTTLYHSLIGVYWICAAVQLRYRCHCLSSRIILLIIAIVLLPLLAITLHFSPPNLSIIAFVVSVPVFACLGLLRSSILFTCDKIDSSRSIVASRTAAFLGLAISIAILHLVPSILNPVAVIVHIQCIAIFISMATTCILPSNPAGGAYSHTLELRTICQSRHRPKFYFVIPLAIFFLALEQPFSSWIYTGHTMNKIIFLEVRLNPEIWVIMYPLLFIVLYLILSSSMHYAYLSNLKLIFGISAGYTLLICTFMLAVLLDWCLLHESRNLRQLIFVNAVPQCELQVQLYGRTTIVEYGLSERLESGRLGPVVFGVSLVGAGCGAADNGTRMRWYRIRGQQRKLLVLHRETSLEPQLSCLGLYRGQLSIAGTVLVRSWPPHNCYRTMTATNSLTASVTTTLLFSNHSLLVTERSAASSAVSLPLLLPLLLPLCAGETLITLTLLHFLQIRLRRLLALFCFCSTAATANCLWALLALTLHLSSPSHTRLGLQLGLAAALAVAGTAHTLLFVVYWRKQASHSLQQPLKR